MSRKQPPGIIQRVTPRVGEGHTVDVVTIGEAGSSTVGRMDLGGLPVPERRYAADSAAVMVEPSMVKLLFGQKQPIGGGLLSLVVISMAFESVHQFLDSIDEEFEENFRRVAERLPEEALAEFKEPAEQTVVLNSSIVLAGYTGSISCMDFYFASPFSVRQLVVLKKLSVEPIVRINLPSTLLFAMIKGLRERVASPSFPLPKSALS